MVNALPVITRQQLQKLKVKAIRSGVWFKALRRIDRVLVELTMQVTDSIHSTTLAESILQIIAILEGAMETHLKKITAQIGIPLARKASLIAQGLGNRSAKQSIKQ